MTRLTRFINSPESRLLLTSVASRRNLSASTHFIFASRIPKEKFSPNLLQIFIHHHRCCFFSTLPNTFRTPPAMEPAGGSDTSPPEDFIHVVNPDDATAEISVDESDPNPGPASPSTQLPDGVAAANAAAAAREEEDVSGGDDPSPVREPEEGLGRQRPALPEELAGAVVVLECESSAVGGSCEVCLVGTSHVSQESCREVQAVVRHFKPQVVFLELCSGRVAILTPHNLQIPTVKDMIDMWKKKKMNPFGILYSWFLAKVAGKLEVLPGSEFRVAFEEARSYGAKVVLGDRPVQITLRRTWGKMPLWHKIKFLYYILFQAIFLPSPEDLNKMLKEMDDVDMLTLVIQEMSKEFPTLMETLVHERDLYMSSTLLKVASEHASVVAVVGKGHLQGIKKHWKQPVEVKDLLETPANLGTPTMTVLKAIGAAATGIAIISGIYLASKRSRFLTIFLLGQLHSGEVRTLMSNAKGSEQEIEVINDLQRLGITYQFKKQIEEALILHPIYVA